jgi:NitT/TauT family transport system permease protein
MAIEVPEIYAERAADRLIFGRATRLTRRYAPALAVFVLVILAWEWAFHYFQIGSFLLRPPSSIARKFVELCPPASIGPGFANAAVTFVSGLAQPSRWSRLGLDVYGAMGDCTLFGRGLYTFMEAIGGYIIGCGLGLLVGLGIARWPAASRLIMPYAIATNSIPIIALSPIMTVWFGIEQGSKIAIVAVMTFFPMLLSTIRGLHSADRASLDLMRSYAATELEVFFKLRLPTALPFMFSALKVATTLSMIGAVVAEFFGGFTKALGVYIKSEASLLHLDEAWAAIIVACVLGIAFYWVIALIERLALPWHVSFRTSDE